MTQQLNENSFIRTQDLALATAISLSFSIENIDRQNPRKAQFIFKRNPKLDEFIERYWHRKIKVEPTAYFEALRVIKARLYEI